MQPRASVSPAPLTAHVPGDGLLLRYEDWTPHQADGPPVVLLHGITESAVAWRGVAARLVQHRRVIALDARWHGGSGWSAEEAYAPDHHFADLATALDALNLAHIDLVGFSMGGAVATMYAAASPERVARLVIVDAYPDPELSPGSRRIAAIVAAVYGDAHATRGGFDPAIARRMREDLEAGAARRLDLWPFWEAVRSPALIVRGALSDVLTAELAAAMLARQPQARLVTIAGTGHQIPSQRPVELSAAILSLDARRGVTLEAGQLQ